MHLLTYLICFSSLFLAQGRFADALLRELAGVAIPPERIYGLGTGLVYSSGIIASRVVSRFATTSWFNINVLELYQITQLNVQLGLIHAN